MRVNWQCKHCSLILKISLTCYSSFAVFFLIITFSKALSGIDEITLCGDCKTQQYKHSRGSSYSLQMKSEVYLTKSKRRFGKMASLKTCLKGAGAAMRKGLQSTFCPLSRVALSVRLFITLLWRGKGSWLMISVPVVSPVSSRKPFQDCSLESGFMHTAWAKGGASASQSESVSIVPAW